MVLNCYQIYNYTKRDMKTNNRANTGDNVSISGGGQTFHHAWLGGTTEPLEIMWESDNKLIIKLWDDHYRLHYSTPVKEGSVAVDGKIDFGISINDTVVTIYESSRGKFKKNNHSVLNNEEFQVPY